jgi:hypothetical protein
MSFFAGNRTLHYELLSFVILIGFPFVIFLQSWSNYLVLSLWLWLCAFSSAWAAYEDLNSMTSKILSRSPVWNSDAHHALTFAIMALCRHSSGFLMIQTIVYHFDVLGGGKLLSGSVSSAIRKFVRDPVFHQGVVVLDIFAVGELAILVVIKHSLKALLCFLVYIVLESAFRYSRGGEERACWHALYQAVVNLKQKETGWPVKVLNKVVGAADQIAEGCLQLWPIGPIKAKIN